MGLDARRSLPVLRAPLAAEEAVVSHHANDGSASRVLRGLLRQHGYAPASLPGLLAAAAAQDIACTEGRHMERVAQPRYVTYVAGEQVPPGTRYCRRCYRILPPEATP